MKTCKTTSIFIVTIMLGVLLFATTASAQSQGWQCSWGVSPQSVSLGTCGFCIEGYCPPGAPAERVGIGTATPESILHVVGETRLIGKTRITEICDQNGQNCKTVSTGWASASSSLNTPNGSQTNVVYVNNSANVGVGTTNPQSKFAVNGTITAKEVKVTQTGWSDYVFAEGYRLLPLDELEAYVGTEKHLPGIPSAKEVEKDGLAIADTLSKQMQKIEELTLYMIQLKKENEQLKERITALEKGKYPTPF